MPNSTKHIIAGGSMELTITKDKARLEHLEGIISRNLQSFYEVGRALMEIRDNQLYEKVRGIANFETYCRERWDFHRSHAQRLIDSVIVIDNVSDRIQKPINIEQTRPLAKLRENPDAQRIAWDKAVETAPDGRVTAAHVAKVVKTMMPEDEKSPPIKLGKPTYAMNFATIAISQLERIDPKDPRREEALQSVMNWIIKNMKGTKNGKNTGVE